MKKSGSAKRLAWCALVMMILFVLVGLSSISQGVMTIREALKLSERVRQEPMEAGLKLVFNGAGAILVGVVMREMINAIGIIVAAHDRHDEAAMPQLQSAAAPVAPATVSSGWVCVKCGTANADGRKACEVCGRDRTAPEAREIPRKSLSIGELLDRATRTSWKCPECGSDNPLSVGSCGNCGGVKPKDV